MTSMFPKGGLEIGTFERIEFGDVEAMMAAIERVSTPT
jgi:hypothetical protein